MKTPLDHDLRIWVDAATFLALHKLAEEDDRSLSEYCRHVLVMHLRRVSAQIHFLNSGPVGPVRDVAGS